MAPAPLTHSRVLSLAWPIVLAQAATAFTGVVDTAVMAANGDKVDLGAVAIAAMAFGFIYWGFGFLRMATTSLTAQAIGRKDTAESHAVLVRALLLGLAFAAVLIALFLPIRWLALTAFQAEADVETLAQGYFNTRIWGAPALLMGYGITGWMIGTGRTRSLLAYQVVLNAINAGLDTWFVAGLGWGPAGIGAGTAIAEWTALGFGLWLVRDGFRGYAKLIDRDKLTALINANRDIMIRTLALIFCFGWFVNSGAKQSTAELAGNEVLLQFITVAAYVLDSFAYVSEKEVGEAYGAGDRARVKRAFVITTQLAFGFGILISALFYAGGGWIIESFVRDDEARAAALTYLPWCAAVPLIGVAAWQLDGVFLGAAYGRALRTASVGMMLVYVATDLWLAGAYGNAGVWTAFLGMYVYRAIGLSLYWPGLMRRIEGIETSPPVTNVTGPSSP